MTDLIKVSVKLQQNVNVQLQIKYSQQKLMGQCLELKLQTSKYHPTLGLLQEISIDGNSFLLLNSPVASEEQYINWSKNVNKLKYNLQIKDYLYLPVNQSFKKGDMFCQSANKLQIALPLYACTLQEMMQNRCKMRQPLTELEVWYLVLILSKYLRHLVKTKSLHTLTCLHPANILVLSDGSLKLIPQGLIPVVQTGNHLLKLKNQSVPQKLNSIHSQQTTTHIQEITPIHLAGMICLISADTSMFDSFFKKQTNLAYTLNEEETKKMIKNCEEHYSTLLVDTLRIMIQQSSDQNSTLIQKIYKKAELFEQQIRGRMQEHIKFGQFDKEDGQELNISENNTPKQSRIARSSKQRKFSYNFKDVEDNILEEPQRVASKHTVDTYLNIL